MKLGPVLSRVRTGHGNLEKSWNSEIKIAGLEKSWNLKYCQKSWTGHGISNKNFFLKNFYFHVQYSKVLLKREHGATECAYDYCLHVSWKIEKVPWKSHGKVMDLLNCIPVWTLNHSDKSGLLFRSRLEPDKSRSHVARLQIQRGSEDEGSMDKKGMCRNWHVMWCGMWCAVLWWDIWLSFWLPCGVIMCDFFLLVFFGFFCQASGKQP